MNWNGLAQSGIERDISTRLVIIIAFVALLTFTVRRHWLKSAELAGVGIAMMFAAAAWLLLGVLPVAQGSFGYGPAAMWIAVALVLPVELSMGVAFYFLYRGLKREEVAALIKEGDSKKNASPASPKKSDKA